MLNMKFRSVYMNLHGYDDILYSENKDMDGYKMVIANFPAFDWWSLIRMPAMWIF